MCVCVCVSHVLLLRLQAPFRLSCPVPGRARWVTTTIYRFDPAVDWPSDLNCELAWNQQLSSYDGGRWRVQAVGRSQEYQSCVHGYQLLREMPHTWEGSSQAA